MGHRRGHGGRALSNIHTQCNNLKVKMVNPLCYHVGREREEGGGRILTTLFRLLFCAWM